ncbi:hypothetical protein [Zhongshania sp.]|jgi:hypothetical protein|uniref:hypothetical protein n=1 Tax=Zhongshania sp. TaxID=1971902 RepID=UPI0039E2B2B2
MSQLRKHLATVIDVILIALAFGGLLFACSNQESGRQSLAQESAMIVRALYQSPLDRFLSIDAAGWQHELETSSYYRDGDSGLLLDVRYWQKSADSVVEKILEAGYTVDYINTANQRILLWARSAEQLAGLSKIQGVSAVSVSRSAPKMDLTLKVFDELQQ